MMKELYLIWLDDIRNPFDVTIDWLQYSPIGKNVNVIWIKSYDEFVKHITKYGLPDAICFDHDLGKLTEKQLLSKGYSKEEARKQKNLEKSGLDCVNWLIDYCIDHNCELPKYASQSSNPVGKENILGKLQNFERFQKENKK